MKRFRSKCTKWILIADLVLIAVLIGTFAVSKRQEAKQMEEELLAAKEAQEQKEEEEALLTVPDLCGITEEEANELAEESGFTVTVTEEDSEDTEEGYVISQEPEAGTETEDTEISIVVSSGDPDGVELPDFEGLYESRAKSTLEEMGIDYEQEYVHTTEYGQWIVIETDPEAGTKVVPGEDTVTIYVSYGY